MLAAQDSNIGLKPDSFILYKSEDSVLVSRQDVLYIFDHQNCQRFCAFNWERNMPWIGAIMIAIMTVIVNIYINRKSSEALRENTNKQLINAKEISKMKFNKTVLSGNRQLWIKELRELISRILTLSMILSDRLILTKIEQEELRFLIIKAQFMLNVKNDYIFIEALSDLDKCCFEILMNLRNMSDLEEYITKVKDLTHKTLKSEWERVKLGE